MSEALITIEQLGDAVRAALEGEDAPSNGQIRAVPDTRTIRYYTTLGLLDRPSEMRGRTALYGPKHVLQLVAVKRLQAEGLSLAEIQARLAGLGEAKLARVARIEGGVRGIALPTRESEASSSRRRAPSTQPAREDFWRALPAETLAPAETFSATAPQAVRLTPSVLLVVEHAHRLTDDDRRRLTALAAPLLEALEDLTARSDEPDLVHRGEPEEG